MECDGECGVGLESLHKTVRVVVRVFAGDGAVKSQTSGVDGSVQVGCGVGSGLVAETTAGSGFVGRRW